MEVIFIKDLRNQGKKGEIKTVKDGYGKNFLIKNGYAVVANKQNLAELKRSEQLKEKEDAKNKEEALKMKEKLEKIELEFKVKVGSGDKVFGSITAKQIKDSLENKGYNIDKKQIMLDQAITTLGYTDVKINLYANIQGKIKVHLVK